MKFVFEGIEYQGEQIGYIANRDQFTSFIEHNEQEIEDIFTDKLEAQDIFQWDELDIDCRLSSTTRPKLKHLVLIGDRFVQEEAFEGDRLVRTVSGTIYCIQETEVVSP